MILGQKEKFAVEILNFNKLNGNLAPLRIWINSNCIGDFNKKTYIPTFLGRLERSILNKFSLPTNLLDSNKYEIFSYFYENENSGKHILGLEESFDDYLMYFYHKNNFLYYMWCNLDSIGKSTYEDDLSIFHFGVEEIYMRKLFFYLKSEIY